MWRRREACFAEKRVEGDDDEDDMEEFIYLCGGIARIFPVVGEGGEGGGREKEKKSIVSIEKEAGNGLDGVACSYGDVFEEERKAKGSVLKG